MNLKIYWPMNKVVLLLFVILVITTSSIFAQQNSTFNSSSYTTAVGLKFYPTGITFKHFVSIDKRAVEFIAYHYKEGSRITGLYEIYKDITNVAGLKWYIGPGAHLAFYTSQKGGNIGIDGVLGLDYKINQAPINLSLDWQPSYDLGNNYNSGFTGDWIGFAVRYTF